MSSISSNRWFGRRSGTATPTSAAGSTDDLSRDLAAANLDKEGEGDGVDEDLALGVGEDLEGDTESETGKFKALLGILRKTLNVKDLTSVRISLPATMMEPVGNLEFWTYIDRPDHFAAIATADDSELDQMLAVLRWMFTKELKYAKHPIAKPFNSILGEHFHCYYDTPVLSLSSKSKEPVPTVHLDERPTAEILTNSGRGSNNNATTAAALKSSPSAANICVPSSARKGDSVASSAASAASTRSAHSASDATSVEAPEEAGTARVVVLNEQTSHHPPISHFWSEARVMGKAGTQRIVRCSGVDQLSAKFTGANVRIVPGPSNRGLFVDLPERNETYSITHPTAAVAGLIRAAPYATICDTTSVTVGPLHKEERETEVHEGKRKRLRAIVAYQEESWISRPRFAVEGVIYESVPNEAASESIATPGDDKRFTRFKQVPKEKIVGTLEGNWRGEIKFKKAGESSAITLVDLLPLSVVPKTVAPIEDQDALETRKVWQPVCEALYKQDYNTASREKQRIEQVQRDKAQERKKKGETYRPVFFEPEPDDPSEWDGRPRLTEAGKAVLERDFRADYNGSGNVVAKTA